MQINNTKLGIYPLFLTGLILLSNCASYKPTLINDSYKGSVIAINHLDKVQILTSYYSLKKVDNLEGSHKTSFDSDQRLSKQVVEEQLTVLCESKDDCVSKYYLTNSNRDILSKMYIDLKIHQYVSWGDVFIQILPVYYSVNESYCVTADIYKDGEIVKNIEEWGYTKESGFWIIEFPEKPNSARLRAYLVQKVLDRAIKELK